MLYNKKNEDIGKKIETFDKDKEEDTFKINLTGVLATAESKASSYRKNLEKLKKIIN